MHVTHMYNQHRLGRLRLKMALMEALTHLKVFREDELDQKRRGDA